MRYLTSSVQASVAILFPVCRWLSDRDQATYSEMAASLRPDSLVKGKDDALRASLSVGSDIGLFESARDVRESDSNTKWALSELMLIQRDEWYKDPIKFRILVRSSLLAKAVDEITENKPPSDVAVGLAWLLAQDPARPPAFSHGAGPEEALADQKLSSFIGTAEQWRGLVRWAQALGCATVSSIPSARGSTYLLPDPTPAIREELPAARPGGLTAMEFNNALVTSLPILDGGRIADYMRLHRAATIDPKGDAEVGPAFSFALRRLQNRRLIDLVTESDSTYRVSGVLHGERWTFDRVTYPGGGSDD